MPGKVQVTLPSPFLTMEVILKTLAESPGSVPADCSARFELPSPSASAGCVPGVEVPANQEAALPCAPER